MIFSRRIKLTGLVISIVILVAFQNTELSFTNSENKHVKEDQFANLHQKISPTKARTPVNRSTATSQTSDGFHKKLCPATHGKVALLQLTIGDDFIHRVAWNALQSVRCYARMRGYALYQFRMVGNHLMCGAEAEEMKQLDTACEVYNSLLPKRHCLAAQLLNKYDYVVHIDADSGVINPNHCFEEFIVPKIHLHFLLRLHSGEVQAGHYIAKNTPRAKDFLMTWAKATKDGGHANDQPQLHDLLSKKYLTTDEHSNCTKVKPKGYYVWIKCILGSIKKHEIKNNEVLFYARGQTFVRDGWSSKFYWSNSDFMLHSMKRQDDILFTRRLKAEDCAAESWVLPYKLNYRVNMERMKNIWKEREKHFRKIYPHFGRLDNLDECWPKCSNIVS